MGGGSKCDKVRWRRVKKILGIEDSKEVADDETTH